MNYRGHNQDKMAQRKNTSPYGNNDRANEVNRTMLEQENDTRWLELGEQVSLLKAVLTISPIQQ
jgi:hypothetical protein